MRLLAVTAIGAGAAAAALGATLFGEIAAGLGAADRASS
jgi:predicted porin